MKPFGLTKKERLSSKKSIEALFNSARSAFSFPLKAHFIINDTGSETIPEILFVVPKKKFKKAVDRNKLRRRMKEGYRLNKQILFSWCLDQQKEVKIAFIYVSSEPTSFQSIEESIIKLLGEITNPKEYIP